MRRNDDDELGEIARDLLRRATLIQLRDDACELATLEPIPTLPTDPRSREQTLMMLLARERQRSRRLLALVAR